jgi:hypothetical protein
MGHRHRAIRGEGGFKALAGLVILVLGAIAAFRIVPLHIRGGEIYDAMNEQANFGGFRTPDKLQYEVFRKAQENRAPLALTDIKVYRAGNNIIIEAKYTEAVDVLGYHYVYIFDKKVDKPTF